MGRLSSWLLPGRATEATANQRYISGATGDGTGYDPKDNVYGWRRVNQGGPREIPDWTRARAVADSIAAWRINPMARAIIDTYVGFVVGDSGLTLRCSSDEVRPFAERFWNHPRNNLVKGRELMVRQALIMGEAANEMMVGDLTGVSLRNPIDTTRVRRIDNRGGNPLWPETLWLRQGAGADDVPRSIASIDPVSGLYSGDLLWWPMFKTLETDTRGMPFLAPILDWLDSYDQVLANLVDRTAVQRYIAADVTLKGEQADVDAFIQARGGTHLPRSGTAEIHNESVEWNFPNTQTGSYEDTNTTRALLTQVAAGPGLAKTWLAEPDGANRATSMTMAEPVRRRIGSVQNEWCSLLTEMNRYAIDQLVTAGRIPVTVSAPGPAGSGTMIDAPASETVTIDGPAIAAADAQITAEVLTNVSQALDQLRTAGLLSAEAAKLAAQKAWTDYVGVPWREDLADPNANPADVATHVDNSGGGSGPVAQLTVA